MSASYPSPPPHPKKGLSGFAIAGIGCLGILVLLFLGGGFIVAKYMPQFKEKMAEFEKDPAKAAVWALELNPDIEVLNKDDAKREITFKTKSTGETTTFSYDDLQNGKMSVKNDKGEEYSFDASKAQTDGVVMKGPDGRTITAGAAAASAPPEEVPLYPGLVLQDGGYRMDQPDAVTGLAVGSVQADMVKIKEHYETLFKAAGYEVTSVASGSASSSVTGTKNDGKSTISVIINPSAENPEQTQVTTQYHLPKP
jgi:hypothetical protein